MSLGRPPAKALDCYSLAPGPVTWTRSGRAGGPEVDIEASGPLNPNGERHDHGAIAGRAETRC